MPQLFKSATPVRLASIHGFIAWITPEGTEVPDVCYPEAYALGAVPMDARLPTADSPQLTDDERDAELRSAITALIAKNNPKDFNLDGSPRVHSVRKVVSWDATGDEVRTAYEALTHGV